MHAAAHTDFPPTHRDLVGPVLFELQALITATHDVHDKLELVHIGHALRQLADGGDVERLGREAGLVVIAQVEAVDVQLENVERRVGEGGLDWGLIRRHMLLASRRHRLVALAVLLEDLVHALRHAR